MSEINAAFEIDGCTIGDPVTIPIVKFVDITIEGGTFTGAYTGHETDETNDSLKVEGLTEATLALPVVDGGVWDARVHYQPNTPDFISLTVDPEATHHEDEFGVSFHTLRRGSVDVTYKYEEVEPPPLPAPENFSAEGMVEFISVHFDAVPEAGYGDSYLIEVVSKPGESDWHEGVPGEENKIDAVVGPYKVRVKAVSAHRKSFWTTYQDVEVVGQPVDDVPESVRDLVTALRSALVVWEELYPRP